MVEPLILLFLAVLFAGGLPHARRRLKASLDDPAIHLPWPKGIIVAAVASVLLIAHLVGVSVCKVFQSSCEFEVAAGSGGAVAAYSVRLAITSLIEELVFRGFLLALLIPRIGFRAANHVQAVLFALSHVIGAGRIQLFPLVPYYIGGLLFGALAKRDTSLSTAILAHLGLNLSFLILGSNAISSDIPAWLSIQFEKPSWLLIFAYWISMVAMLSALLRAFAMVSPKKSGPSP